MRACPPVSVIGLAEYTGDDEREYYRFIFVSRADASLTEGEGVGQTASSAVRQKLKMQSLDSRRGCSMKAITAPSSRSASGDVVSRSKPAPVKPAPIHK